MRMQLFLVGMVYALAACGNQGFIYLTRPGAGSTGSIEESNAYYAAMTDRPPEATLAEWRSHRCFNDQTELSAFYYNASDLGLGREMRCAQCTSGPNVGLISCVVSNHGVPQGLDALAFQRDRTQSIQLALTQMEDFLAKKRAVRGASVAMDFDPNRPTDDKVRFYIYDASDPMLLSPGNTIPEALIPGLQLDGEGGAFNQGVKFIRNCLSCHGGRFDAESNRIFGSSFLDFDISLFVFADDPVLGSANANKAKRSVNLDSMRRLNGLVRQIDRVTGAREIVARIDGSYSGDVEQGLSEYIGPFIPAGWPATQKVRDFNGRSISAADFFSTVVHPYCATCHFAQVPQYNLSQVDSSKPLTFSSIEQWFANKNISANPSDGLDVIRQDVCSSVDMPHAEVTRSNFLRDPTALAYICN